MPDWLLAIIVFVGIVIIAFIWLWILVLQEEIRHKKKIVGEQSMKIIALEREIVTTRFERDHYLQGLSDIRMTHMFQPDLTAVLDAVTPHDGDYDQDVVVYPVPSRGE